MTDQRRSLTADFNSNSGDQTQRHHWYDRPHGELVDVVKSAVARARVDTEAKGQPFDPVKWISLQLTQMHGRASGDAHRNRSDITLAWDVISRPFIQDHEYQRTVDSTLLSGTALRRSSLVTLNREARTLINVMADAVGVTHDHKQTTIDLLPNPSTKQLFKSVYTVIAKEAGIK